MYTTSGDELHPSSRLTSGKLDDNSASKEPVDLESPLGHNLVLHEINQTMRDLDQFNCRHYGGSTGLRLYGLHSRPQFRPLRDVTQEQEGDSLNVNNIFNDNREINNDTDGSRNDNQNSNNKPSYATNSRANWTDGDGNGARCAAKLPSAMWAPSLHLLLFVLVILAQRSSGKPARRPSSGLSGSKRDLVARLLTAFALAVDLQAQPETPEATQAITLALGSS